MGMFDSILVATDGSPFGDAALEAAYALARDYAGTLHACVAVEPSAAPAGRHIHHWDQRTGTAVRAAEAVAHDAERRAASIGLSLEANVRHGTPVEQILQTARAVGATVIVVGNRGRGALETLLTGSATQGLLEAAHVPVLVVRPAENER